MAISYGLKKLKRRSPQKHVSVLPWGHGVLPRGLRSCFKCFLFKMVGSAVGEGHRGLAVTHPLGKEGGLW